MIDLVTIDPGIKVTGVACFASLSPNPLFWAGSFVLPPKQRGKSAQSWLDVARGVLETIPDNLIFSSPLKIVVEVPQVYRRRREDPNDLIDLAGVAGAVMGAICGVFSIRSPWLTFESVGLRPSEWKGNTPKDIENERTRTKLSQEELSRVDLGGRKRTHDIWDAVGIGLHVLGR